MRSKNRDWTVIEKDILKKRYKKWVMENEWLKIREFKIVNKWLNVRERDRER